MERLSNYVTKKKKNPSVVKKNLERQKLSSRAKQSKFVKKASALGKNNELNFFCVFFFANFRVWRRKNFFFIFHLWSCLQNKFGWKKKKKIRFNWIYPIKLRVQGTYSILPFFYYFISISFFCDTHTIFLRFIRF